MRKPALRIVYHPAPGPDPRSGGTVTPEPVVLGSDLRFAFAWIRRRLGLGRPSRGLKERPLFLPPER